MKLNIKKIKAELVRLDWTYKRLAQEMGIERTYIYAYLNNESNPTLRTVQKFADALDLDARDLLR